MKNVLVKKIITSEDIVNRLFIDKGKVYSFLNPVSYLDARKNATLFTQLDGVFSDGSLLVKAIGILYGKKIIRRSFDMTSLASKLFSFADTNCYSCYVVASKLNEVESSINVLKDRYPRVSFIGYRDGYFSSDEEQDREAEKISILNPDFLVVGMGVLKQEEFILRVKGKGYQGIGFTCGGFIHQIANNNVDYYPSWIDHFNLRFIFRMIKEKHTRIRYLKSSILFPVCFIYDYYCYRINCLYF